MEGAEGGGRVQSGCDVGASALLATGAHDGVDGKGVVPRFARMLLGHGRRSRCRLLLLLATSIILSQTPTLPTLTLLIRATRATIRTLAPFRVQPMINLRSITPPHVLQITTSTERGLSERLRVRDCAAVVDAPKSSCFLVNLLA